MFNFAAKMSERIRNSSSTSVVPFESDDAEQSSAPTGRGGGGDETHLWHQGAQDASQNLPGLDPVGVVQLTGDTGSRSRNAAHQNPGQQWVSPPRDRASAPGYSARDERNLKPSGKGSTKRSPLPRRSFWRLRHNKVHPLNTTNGSLSGHDSSGLPGAADSPRSAPLIPAMGSVPPPPMRRRSRAAGLESGPIDPDYGEHGSSSPITHRGGLQHHPDVNKPNRPWRARLRGLLPPSNRRKTTAVVPLKRTRQPGRSLEEQQKGRHVHHQTHEPNGLKKTGAKESAVTHYRQSYETTMSTRSRPPVPASVDPLHIPGVPQFDFDNHSPQLQTPESQLLPRDSQGQQLRLVSSYTSSRPQDSPVSSSSSEPSTPVNQPARLRDGGDTACHPKRSISKRTPRFTSSKDTDSNVRETDRINQLRTEDAATSLVGKQPIAYPVADRSIKPNDVTLRQERIALKVDVTFIYLGIAGRGPSPSCRWAEVMQSCLDRRQRMHRALSANNQQMSYTSDQIQEIEANARTATDKLNLLKQTITFASFLQPIQGDQQVGLFRHIDISLPRTRKSEDRPPRKETRKTPSQAIKKSASPSLSSPSAHLPLSTPVGCSRPQEESFLESSGSSSSTEISQRDFPNDCAEDEKISSILTTPASSTSSQSETPPSENSSGLSASPRLTSQLTSQSDSPGDRGSPMFKRHQRLAPSCLKKVQPNLPSYPTIDDNDLDFVDGNVTLGSGAFGRVVLMRRKEDGVLLAVKTVLDEQFRIFPDEKMLSEVAALQAVKDSQFFPKLYGVIDNSSFALEFIGDAQTYSAMNFKTVRMEHALLTAWEWLHVCRDITQGLMDLHREDWIHCDIHWQNAMLCRNPPGSDVGWTGKIIDLGCAKQRQNLPSPMNWTAEEVERFSKDCTQVAPEILRGETRFSVEGDIYGLGRVFLKIAYETSSLRSLHHLGMACTRRQPLSRPKLGNIYKKLDMLCFKMALSKQSPLPPLCLKA